MAVVLTLFQNESELTNFHANELSAAQSVTRIAISKGTQSIPHQDNAFDTVYVACQAGDLHGDALLREIHRVLRPGGRFIMVEKLSPERRRDVVENALLFAGFMDWEMDCLSSDTVEIKTQKPEWAGTAFTIATQQATQPKNLAIWTNPDDDDGNVEYEDEDAILEDEDITPSKKYDDCGSGKKGRKACKNCTCGRSEQDVPASKPAQTGNAASTPAAAPKRLTLDDTNDMPKSGCGNCSLGDAFRCTGCPYMGLPPFKPGEKVQVSLADDI